MPIYRILIEPRSLQITPWQADTLFGSLCWAYRHRYGESALQEFLQPFLSGEPSFLLSDGIAEGHLPLPYYLRILPVDVNDTRRIRRVSCSRRYVCCRKRSSGLCRGERAGE